MSARLLLGGAALVLWLGHASAHDPYQQAMAELEVNALGFILAQGHVPVDSERVTDDLYYSERNFPDAGNGLAVRLPDAELDALTRSILFLETQAAPLPHVRYHMTYSRDASVDMPEAQQAYVEITRYNLGPSRHEALLHSVPDGQVAELAQFGVGPHVSWRFVMAPVMGMRAGLLWAGRKEVTDAQARAADCLGEPCLSLIDPSGPSLSWKPISAPQLESPAYVGATDWGVSGAARGMQELWESMASDGMDPLPYNAEQPHFVFVVSLNVAGQEAALSALAKQGAVMDDSVSEIWTQRYEVAGMPAQFSTLAVPRR